VFRKGWSQEHFDATNKREKLTKNWYSLMQMLVVLSNNDNQDM